MCWGQLLGITAVEPSRARKTTHEAALRLYPLQKNPELTAPNARKPERSVSYNPDIAIGPRDHHTVLAL
jgi:hypothetical protein